MKKEKRKRIAVKSAVNLVAFTLKPRTNNGIETYLHEEGERVAKHVEGYLRNEKVCILRTKALEQLDSQTMYY